MFPWIFLLSQMLTSMWNLAHKTATSICQARRGAQNSPFVERVWRSHSDGGGSFLSTAISHWEIVVTKNRNGTTLTVRGPETCSTAANCPPDSEFMGIVFKVGSFMPKFPPRMVMDRRDLNLPQAGSNSFWLGRLQPSNSQASKMPNPLSTASRGKGCSSRTRSSMWRCENSPHSCLAARSNADFCK